MSATAGEGLSAASDEGVSAASDGVCKWTWEALGGGGATPAPGSRLKLGEALGGAECARCGEP